MDGGIRVESLNEAGARRLQEEGGGSARIKAVEGRGKRDSRRRDRSESKRAGGADVNDWTRWWCGVARSTGTNRFIDELSRIKAGPTGRPRAISHANVFPLNFEKLFYHRFPVLAISVAPKVV